MKRIIASLILLICFACGMAQTLLIYGGKDHDVYLGKLNGTRYDQESIWNKYGSYGNKYNSNSIWNKYGTYGNEYSRYSPWNKLASDPPVIVDSQGNFYGYFTVNEYRSNRCHNKVATFICRHYKDIRDNPSEWYDELF